MHRIALFLRAIQYPKLLEIQVLAMSIKKQFLKSKPICKVTFKIAKEVTQGARSVAVLGDFNGWNADIHPMEPLKNGTFALTVELPTQAEYKFRYLIDGERWENENEADMAVISEFGDSQNSVLLV